MFLGLAPRGPNLERPRPRKKMRPRLTPRARRPPHNVSTASCGAWRGRGISLFGDDFDRVFYSRHSVVTESTSPRRVFADFGFGYSYSYTVCSAFCILNFVYFAFSLSCLSIFYFSNPFLARRTSARRGARCAVVLLDFSTRAPPTCDIEDMGRRCLFGICTLLLHLFALSGVCGVSVRVFPSEYTC